MKLLDSTNKKITCDKNKENTPHLAITEVVLLQCIIVNKTKKNNFWKCGGRKKSSPRRLQKKFFFSIYFNFLKQSQHLKNCSNSTFLC